jgi:hypothetical protein
MTTAKTLGAALLLAACGLMGLGLLSGAEPEPAKGEVLIVIDGAGKEHKIKTWKITHGVRPLSWLAPTEKKEPEPEKKEWKKDPRKGREKKLPAGPLALEFREEASTNFVEGITTFIPLERIRSIDYDPDTDSVSVTVATGDDKAGDVVLKGTTKYRGVNKLTIEAEVDKGELGIAEVKFLGGVPKGGIRSVRFPSPKAPAAMPAGRTADITTSDKKDKGPFKVSGSQALYRLADGSERLLPYMFFKKTLRVDLSKLEKVQKGETSKEEGTEWSVKFKDGEEHTLSLLFNLPDDETAHLEGVLGRVPAGYRLFPIGLIAGIEFSE